MTQSAPGYQPYQQPPPVHQQAPVHQQPPPRRARGGLNGLLAAIAALVAAGLTVGGLFGPISTYRSEESFDGDSYVVGWRNDWWGFGDDGSTDPVPAETVLTGLVLVLAAVLLVAGAVFLLVARNRGGTSTVGRTLTVAGVGVLTGAVLLELILSMAELSRHNEEELSAGETLEFSLGIGLFLPLGAAMVGIAAAVLAHLRQTPGRVEPVTPPMGFRQPYGSGPHQMQGYAQQPHAQVPADERPTTVDTPGTESPAGAGQEAEVTQQVTVQENPAPAGAPGSPQAGSAQPGHTQPGHAQQGFAQQGQAQFGGPGAQQGQAHPGVAGAPQQDVGWSGTSAGGQQPFVPPAPMSPVGTPPQGAFAAPPQPPAPAQPVPPVEQALNPQPASPAAPEDVAAPEQTPAPAQTSAQTPPAAPEAVAAPAQAPAEAPVAPAEAPAAPAQAPATPAQAEAPAQPTEASEKPAESTEEPPAGPAISGLSDLPAAPPAPELSGEDGTEKKD